MGGIESARALDHLRRLLAIGRFDARGRLPPERALASELGCGRLAVRRALDILEGEGRIRRQVGRGTFIGGAQAEKPGVEDITLCLASPGEWLELRILLEPQCAGLAAIRADPGDIAHMRHCLDKLGGRQSTREHWLGSILRTIALASRNRPLADLIEQLARVAKARNWPCDQRLAALPDFHREPLKRLFELVRWISARDPARSAGCMREYLQVLQRALFEGDDDWSVS